MKVKRNKIENQKYSFDLDENDIRGLSLMDMKTKGLKRGLKNQKWLK